MDNLQINSDLSDAATMLAIKRLLLKKGLVTADEFQAEVDKCFSFMLEAKELTDKVMGEMQFTDALFDKGKFQDVRAKLVAKLEALETKFMEDL